MGERYEAGNRMKIDLPPLSICFISPAWSVLDLSQKTSHLILAQLKKIVGCKTINRTGIRTIDRTDINASDRTGDIRTITDNTGVRTIERNFIRTSDRTTWDIREQPPYFF